MAHKSEKNGQPQPLAYLENLARSSELSRIFSGGLSRHIEHLQGATVRDPTEQALNTRDIVDFSSLKRILETRFSSYVTRDTVLSGIKSPIARISMALSGEIDRTDPHRLRLRLFEPTGARRQAQEFALTVRPVPAMSPTARTSIRKGYTVPVESVIQTGGIHVELSDNRVGLDPSVFEIRWRPDIGVSALFRENGYIHVLPKRYQEPGYTATPVELTHTHRREGSRILEWAKKIFS